jgi:hypothetical protein
MLLMTQNMLSCYASYVKFWLSQVNSVEVFRARNSFWNDLL